MRRIQHHDHWLCRSSISSWSSSWVTWCETFHSIFTREILLLPRSQPSEQPCAFPYSIRKSIGIIQRILSYQKQTRTRLSYSWRPLWNGMSNALSFLWLRMDDDVGCLIQHWSLSWNFFKTANLNWQSIVIFFNWHRELSTFSISSSHSVTPS